MTAALAGAGRVAPAARRSPPRVARRRPGPARTRRAPPLRPGPAQGELDGALLAVASLLLGW